MKNILVTTDFSENAWNATLYALELFKNEVCVFHLLNTYTPAIASSRFMAASIDGGVLENGAQVSSKRGLQNMVERIRKTQNKWAILFWYGTNYGRCLSYSSNLQCESF